MGFMPPKRLYPGGRCKHGHELTPENTIIRTDRGNCIECKPCQRRGRRDFNTRKPLYDVWTMMLRRCDDPTFKDWSLYGGKTPPVTVCARWRASYDDFAADMGPRPRGTTLDRIDSNGHYEPGNCHWATPKQQARNMSRNRLITFDGRTATIAEWAEILNVKYMTLFQRLHRGWPLERALRATVHAAGKDSARHRTTNHLETYQGETRTVAEWAERHGMNTRQLGQRLRQGWTIDRALTTPIRHYR
jgi:hypothetical protein